MRRWQHISNRLLSSTSNLNRGHGGVSSATARQLSTVVQRLPQSNEPPVNRETSPFPLSSPSLSIRIDPYTALASELAHIRNSLLHLLGSSHPHLTHIAEYYFRRPSKQLRPLFVLLFAQAVNGLGAAWPMKEWEASASAGQSDELDRPLTRPEVLNDWNPNMPDNTASFQSTFDLKTNFFRLKSSAPPELHEQNIPSENRQLNPTILPTQMRLAQIVEMIHVASLLHDDVIDNSPLRRGFPSAPAQFGNKLTILAGDFLLGRASAALSRLGEAEVVELIASVIANLVEGELLQLREAHAPRTIEGISTSPNQSTDAPTQDHWNIYLKKTYLKTASLMAKGARASVVLGGVKDGEIWKEVAYAFGRNIGIAFQLVDDVLDFDSSEEVLGKPGGADLHLGLATAPTLYAWEEHPAMGPLIARKFSKQGDVELARDLVQRSSGASRTRALALEHAEKAREILLLLPKSNARDALESLTHLVVTRRR